MIYGQAITMGGSGGLNIDYGSTPPADTSKLWIPLEKKPDYVEVNGEFMGFGQNVLESWDGKTISPYSLIRVGVSIPVGDYIYVFDNNSKKVLRYNPSNGTFTECCSFSDVGSVSMYRACKVDTDIIFVGSTSTGVWYRFSTTTNTIERISFNTFTTDTGFSSFIEFGGVVYQFLTASGNYVSSNAYRADIKNKTFTKLNAWVPNCNNNARPYVWVYNGKIWLLSVNSSTVYLTSYDTASDTYTTVKSGTYASFGLSYTLSFDSAYGAASPIPVIGSKVYLLPAAKTSGSTSYRNGNVFILDMETLMFTESSSVLEVDDGYSRQSCGFALYDMGMYMIGGDNYTYNTTSSNGTTANTKVNVYRAETHLTENSLKIFTDVFGKQTALVNGKDSKLYATVREAFLGNEDGYARATDAYIYNESTGKWQTLDGVSVTQDMLNALAE